VNSTSRGAGQAAVNSGSGDLLGQVVGGGVSVRLCGVVGWVSGVIEELIWYCL
jgi:hypothetical protein